MTITFEDSAANLVITKIFYISLYFLLNEIMQCIIELYFIDIFKLIYLMTYKVTAWRSSVFSLLNFN